MRWSWLKLDNEQPYLEIPAEHYKTAKAHVVPLSSLVLDILTQAPRFSGSDYALTATGRRPISGFSAAKKRIDAISGVSGWAYARSPAHGEHRVGPTADRPTPDRPGARPCAARSPRALQQVWILPRETRGARNLGGSDPDAGRFGVSDGTRREWKRAKSMKCCVD